MNYHVIDGKGPEFEKVFAKVLGIMQAMDGHECSNLYNDVANRNSYLIVSEWNDRAAFDAFTKSKQFAGVVEFGKSRILASRPKHEIYGADSAPASGCPVAH